MNQEIERKFFIKYLPDVTGIEKTYLERHFLFEENGIELRIQTNGSTHTLQRKVSKSDTERTTEKIEISLQEFNLLRKLSISSIHRESYHLSDNPTTDIRVYHGPYEGLIRAEFEFNDTAAMNEFQPPRWVGKEITGSPLARDAQLLKLNPEEFKNFIEELG